MTQNLFVPHTKLDDLNLVDKFLFDETMEDVESYQATISILTENETALLSKPETEKELRISPELREIRLDVISMDKDKNIYYSEMQKKNTYNLTKRSRYYQAQLDVSLLEPGSVDFNQLNDSCFILIAPFDIFGKGLYRYTFEGTCLECPELKINDGARRIFINTNGTNREDFSQEFLDFMNYITSSTDETANKTTSSKIKLIHQNVRKIKASEKMGVKFMQQWEVEVLARQEGHEEGIKKGLQTGLENGIKALIVDNLEENIPKERIIKKLIRHFSLTENKANEYYLKYSDIK